MAGQRKKPNKKPELTEEEKRQQDIKMRFKFWLHEKYELQFIPQYFFDKLETVYNGAYKNLNSPVSVTDLWDMWERQMPNLLKTHDWNKKKGNKIEGANRLSYDLAIVLSKYDSYLAWKEKQQEILIEQQQRENEAVIDYSHMTQNSRSQKNSVDISKLLDEIF